MAAAMRDRCGVGSDSAMSPGAMAVERGVHHSSAPSGSQPAVSSDESDDNSGFFDDGGLAPSQGVPSTSTQTS
jgi:hypothetical protein